MRITETKAGLWARLKRLAITDVGALLRKLNAEDLERIEQLLLEADLGVPATMEIVASLEGQVRAGKLKTDVDLHAAFEEELARLLAGPADPGRIATAAVPPTVILVMGVNGVGKTTSVAKLAHRLKGEGRKLLLAAADTYRAGAVAQLEVWAERLDLPCVSGTQGGDPAAVAFDAVTAAKARGADTVLIDTAGRLHTQDGLMEELRKVHRVVARQAEGAPHEALLVLDGTVGQNAVRQGKQFAEVVPPTGIIVTKLDGTARGGAVVALRRELNVPVRFIGTGEGIDDLSPFDPRAFARAILGEYRVATLRLDTPVKFLKGIGERRAELFYKLGVQTAQDLLWHLPHRYLDASAVTPLAEARVGGEYACIGRVVTKKVVPFRRLRVFRAVLRDDSGVLECVWPGQAFLDRTIREGQTLLVTGPVKFYHGRQMAPREFVVLDEPEDEAATEAALTSPQGRVGREGVGKVLPVYPATEGLSHKTIRALVDRHLADLIALAHDTMPPAVLDELDLPPLAEALRDVHRPKDLAEAERGRRRLAFDELFDLQLTLARARFLAKTRRQGIRFEPKRDLTTKLRESLPFEFTAGQKQALKEIVADMGSGERMHRLLMGDVGTGKTVVALFAMLLAVENGYQAALMAPTELLAEQHARTLATMLAPLGILPELVLGRHSAAEKQAARKRLADGGARIVVGTHALFQEGVQFRKLGLVVIDEQHRFGVEQRAALIGKGEGPDVLLLTATPIPRSLALTLYGDLDVSTLRERPPGRGEITTAVRSAAGREKVWSFVHEQLGEGRQGYVVLPIIEESEKADLRAATTMAEELAQRWPDVVVGLVHGRLKADERDQVMRRFRGGEVQLLVSTTVIEVGIDVPNATLMVIDHPERFGLAQLHQLRGRVGRGGNASHCILLTEGRVPPRLKAFAATQDGFKIAELDLAERGMGDLIGARQSGEITIRHARLPDDAELLQRAREMASGIIAKDPDLTRTTNQPLRARALARYPRAVELFRVG